MVNNFHRIRPPDDYMINFFINGMVFHVDKRECDML